MARWLAMVLVLAAGAGAAVAFGGARPRQVGPGLPCLPVGGCPGGSTSTGQTSPPPQGTTTQQTPPPDTNSPPVSDGPAPHHPAHHARHGVTVERLSDERTFTTWATYARAGRVTSKPFGKGRRITVLHRETVDRLPEVYLVLESRRDRHGHVSVRVRVPMRPNGTTGWVTRSALSSYRRVNTLLVVSRSRLRLTLYRAGRPVTSMRVGVGRPGTPTPAGHFWVNERFQVESAPAYGPYAIGTTAFSPVLTDWPGGGVVGIHGTDEPGLIPGHVSHGCVRVVNGDITRLVRLVPLGTPVRIT